MERLLSQDKKCMLLGGMLSYFIQIFLGISAISSLIYKRHIERPQREWNIFMFDVSKQLIGGFFIHCANIIVSHLLKNNGDECAYYFLNFFIDCTIGVFIVYTLHDGFCYIIKIYWNPDSVFAHIGKYGDPPEIKRWLKQVSLYLSALLINKILVGFTLYYFRNKMLLFSNWLFGPLQKYPNIELVVVMILCPWLLTTFQMWIFDHILKYKKTKKNTESLLIINEFGSDNFSHSDYTEDSFSSVTLDD